MSLRQVAVASSAAALTIIVIHPLDVLKVRQQLALPLLSPLGDFWAGIWAAILREITYTGFRLGLLQPIRKIVGAKDKKASFLRKFAAGSMAGTIGALAVNPFDVIKTQMMAAQGGSIRPSLLQVSSAIFQHQGIRGFYKGLWANILRAMVLNGTKMLCYDNIKRFVQQSGIVPPGLPTQFASAFGAGFFMALAVCPVDMIRTCLMNQPPHATKTAYVLLSRCLALSPSRCSTKHGTLIYTHAFIHPF